MNIFKLISLSIIFLLSFSLVSGQNSQKCEVINDDSSGEYVGECKKGLAHGNGIYNFSKGTKVYEGEFKKGKFNGEGILFNIVDGNKEISKKGIWKNNSYKGEKKVRPYTVNRKLNLERYIIRKTGEGNKVEISFFHNGTRNTVRGLNVSSNSGVEIVGSYTRGFQNIEFPFTCELNYFTQNKLGTASFEVRFEFMITEPGSWEVLLYN